VQVLWFICISLLADMAPVTFISYRHYNRQRKEMYLRLPCFILYPAWFCLNVIWGNVGRIGGSGERLESYAVLSLLVRAELIRELLPFVMISYSSLCWMSTNKGYSPDDGQLWPVHVR
jgi:hypothetical protein